MTEPLLLRCTTCHQPMTALPDVVPPCPMCGGDMAVYDEIAYAASKLLDAADGDVERALREIDAAIAEREGETR